MNKKKWLNSKIIFTIAMVFVICCLILTSLWAAKNIDFYSANAKAYIRLLNENDSREGTSIGPVFGLTRDEGFTLLRQGTSVTASQPPVADFSASSYCIKRDDNLTFTDQSTNNPTSWSWTFEGGTPATSTAQNPTVTYNTVDTFNVTLVATNAQGSDTETKLDYIYVAEKPYCTSSGSSQSYEYIASVAVADLNNPSGASPYTDFTILLASLEQGDTVNVSLTPGFPSSSYTEYWRIWIDYNGDHDFEDAGEQVFSGSGSSVVSGSFTVPTSTLTGNTQMRVSMNYSTYPPICGSFNYGEVEDYTANISSAVLPVRYTLTTNTVGQGSVPLDPPGGTYLDGTVVTLTAVPYSGWQFDNWSGDLSGTANPTTITMNSNKTVTANFSEVSATGTVGHTTVFSLSTTTANRRAMPFTMPENGTINSVTMYHTGGSGSMILGVYDGEGLPANRLGVTATTAVSGSTGWQTINLTSPTFVSGGTTVWLAWVYESNPGIYYETGSPGRANSSWTWSGGMPDPFGSSTQSNYIYSIYATYTPSAPSQYTLTTNVVGQGSITLYPPGGIYDEGRVVILTAVPDADWQFDGWSGDLSGTQNPTTITMNADKNVTATFSVNFWGYAEVVDEETYSEWEQEKFVPSLDETTEVPLNETVIKTEFILPDDNNNWYRLEMRINREGEIAVVNMEQVSSSEVASVVGISHTNDVGPWWPVCCFSQLDVCNIFQDIFWWCNLKCYECFLDCLCLRVSNPCHSCGWRGLSWLLCIWFGHC